MLIEWFIRSSKSASKWPLRFICNQCKQRRYMFSLSSFLFIDNQKANKLSFDKFDENEKNKYQYRTKLNSFIPSVVGILTGAATIFSWENDGISDKELCEASSDEYLLNMSSNEINQLLISNDWEKINENDHLILFRKYNVDLQVYSYKMLGSFNDISALGFLQVQLDLDYRMKWDDHALRLSIIETDKQSQSDIIHWIQKFPFPFNNRDYVYVRRYCLDQSLNKTPKILIKCHSINHPNVHNIDKCVRVNKYESSMIIQSKTKLDEKGMKFLLTYHEDAKATMPTSTYSYLAQKGIPNFVEKLHIATKKLPKSKQFLNVDLLPQCQF